MTTVSRSSPSLVRIATVDVLAVVCQRVVDCDRHRCEVQLRDNCGELVLVTAQHADRTVSIAQTVSQLCSVPVTISHLRTCEIDEGGWQVLVAVQSEDDNLPASRAGAGRFVAQDESVALVIATMRAASHAGLLKAPYRANYQKTLREWTQDAGRELNAIIAATESEPELRQLEIEGVLLEHFNRVASAAIVTASNAPRPESILSLFDNSAWLFDEYGRRRDAYTDTSLWLAWYPGINNDSQTIDEVIASMPASPDTAIPWIVRLFENPDGWLRFRGAISLEDHDVLHVLLGRGLQDQDEAFVLGFAMGTAKRISWLEYWVFRWVLTRLYPEPYRVPTFLLPAFELGVKCGRETGAKNLYRQSLRQLRTLTLGDARKQLGIDMAVVRRYYEQEQQAIPFTIASLRLP